MRLLLAVALLAGISGAAHAQPQPGGSQGQASAAFEEGAADRQAWESWFGSLSGDYRAGAEYWSAQRSLPKPDSCYGPGGTNRGDWTAGCLAAQQRLTPSDARRKTEPDYKLGWNSLPATPTQSTTEPSGPPSTTEAAPTPPEPTVATAAFQQGQADRQSWEAWFDSQTGDHRAGADYWASHRSLPNPGSCSAVPPSTGADWTAGCFAAQQRLAGPDVRRKTEPEYRLGWNSPPPVASSPAPPPPAEAEPAPRPEPPMPADEAKVNPSEVPAAGAITATPSAALENRMTMSEIAVRQLIDRCWNVRWNVPAGTKDAKDFVVDIHVTLNQDGSVREVRIVDQSRLQSDSFFRAVAESASRAIFLCQPFRLPPEKYPLWQDMTLSLKPQSAQTTTPDTPHNIEKALRSVEQPVTTSPLSHEQPATKPVVAQQSSTTPPVSALPSRAAAASAPGEFARLITVPDACQAARGLTINSVSRSNAHDPACRLVIECGAAMLAQIGSIKKYLKQYPNIFDALAALNRPANLSLQGWAANLKFNFAGPSLEGRSCTDVQITIENLLISIMPPGITKNLFDIIAALGRELLDRARSDYRNDEAEYMDLLAFDDRYPGVERLEYAAKVYRDAFEADDLAAMLAARPAVEHELSNAKARKQLLTSQGETMHKQEVMLTTLATSFDRDDLTKFAEAGTSEKIATLRSDLDHVERTSPSARGDVRTKIQEFDNAIQELGRSLEKARALKVAREAGYSTIEEYHAALEQARLKKAESERLEAAAKAEQARRTAETEAEQARREAEREREALIQKGVEYAQSSKTTWKTSQTKNEMTDKLDVTVESFQENGAGVVAQIKGECEGGMAIFKALIVDEDGKATIRFPGQTTEALIEGLIRRNDDQATVGLLSSVDFPNEFLVALLATKGQFQEALKKDMTLAQNSALLTFFSGGRFNPFADVTTTWRIMVEIKTTRDPIIVKIPVYDASVRRFVQSCVKMPTPATKLR